MKVEPLNDRVLVLRVEGEEKTAGPTRRQLLRAWDRGCALVIGVVAWPAMAIRVIPGLRSSMNQSTCRRG